MDREEATTYLMYMWQQSCDCFERSYEEPEELVWAKIRAFESLDPASGESFTWDDCQKGYEILYLWHSGKRMEHTKRLREANSNKLIKQLSSSLVK